MYNDMVSYTFYNFDSSMVIFNEYGHSTKGLLYMQPLDIMSTTAN